MLFAFNIGLTGWETVVIVKKGANYGYSLREGSQAMTLQGMHAGAGGRHHPGANHRHGHARHGQADLPGHSVSAHAGSGGDAIAGGFIYRGSRIPALRGKLVFGDITTGRLWYADLVDVLAADDGKAETVAPIHEIEAGLRRIVEDTYRARGGKGETLPGAAAVSGRGRVDIRFAVDNAGDSTSCRRATG